MHQKQVAMLAEKRSRLLRATRQTYEDFFNLDYIGSGHVTILKVSFYHANACQAYFICAHLWGKALPERWSALPVKEVTCSQTQLLTNLLWRRKPLTKLLTKPAYRSVIGISCLPTSSLGPGPSLPKGGPF